MSEVLNGELNLGPHLRYPKSVRPGIPRLSQPSKGWSRVVIGDLFDVINRPVEMDDDAVYQLVTVKRSRGGVCEREKLPGNKIAVKSQFYVEEGDFLISKRQIVHGACGFVPKELHGAIVSNEYSVLKCKDIVSSEFLGFLIHTPYFQQTCFHSSIGVHVEKMIFKLEDWFRWEINIPGPNEQQEISDFLCSITEKIESLKRKYSLLELYKHGVMQKIFSKTIRFRKDNGDDFPKWNNKKLGELTRKTGRKNKENFPYPIYSISNKEGFLPQGDQFEGMDSNLRGYDISLYKVIEKNTFAYNPARINVGSIGFSGELENIIISSLYVCFKTNKELEDRYLMQFVKTYEFNKSVRRNVEGGVREYLFYENFSNIKIPLPSNEEQLKIVEFLDVLDKKIDAVSQQLFQLETFKQGLLQKMFV